MESCNSCVPSCQNFIESDKLSGCCSCLEQLWEWIKNFFCCCFSSTPTPPPSLDGRASLDSPPKHKKSYHKKTTAEERTARLIYTLPSENPIQHIDFTAPTSLDTLP